MLLKGILVLFELVLTVLLLTFGVRSLSEGERLRDFPLLCIGLATVVLGGASLGMCATLWMMMVSGLVH